MCLFVYSGYTTLLCAATNVLQLTVSIKLTYGSLMKGACMLHNAAQVKIISSTSGSNVSRSVFFNILKVFIRLIAFSTVFLNLQPLWFRHIPFWSSEPLFLHQVEYLACNNISGGLPVFENLYLPSTHLHILKAYKSHYLGI